MAVQATEPVASAERARSHWGWGFADQLAAGDALREQAPGLVAHIGFGSTEPELPTPLEQATLPQPRVAIAGSVAAFASDSRYDRARHTYGKAFRDIARGFRGDFSAAPDCVLRPRTEAEIESAIEWCEGARLALIPFGGGSSVVGGVEARLEGSQYNGAVSLDLSELNSLLEVDQVSSAARIGAGAFGPQLESALATHGLTLRCFPQSFEFSTLGGWIATRAGGHYATGRTHVDDLVESVRAVTPTGVWESRRLPASGAGPSPDRMLLGSEGTLGVITEAWMRVVPKPEQRASATVGFPSFEAGAEAARAVVQSGMLPANCRLIDRDEAQLMFAGDGSFDLLILGFEANGYDPAPLLADALKLCEECGGKRLGGGESGGADSADAWRSAFLQAPYLRDTLLQLGVISETFETSITWERLGAFRTAVIEAVTESLREVCGGGRVSCRLTHVYADGAAPYFTVLAPARRGEEVAQWDQIKHAASDALAAAGGTITHHHAVGRDHRPWYDKQRPDPFAAALRAAKRELDPHSVLNPGVLF